MYFLWSVTLAALSSGNGDKCCFCWL